MSRFGTVIGTTFVGGSGGGGGTVDAIARADIAAITGEAGDTIADGETTWISGLGPFTNNTGATLTVPSPATRANMLATGFTEDAQIPSPRVASADGTISQGEHVVGSGAAAITLTAASGVTYFWVSRALDMAFDVVVISADAPTVTIAGDATGANLNEPSGPVLFIQDPTDTNNFLAVTNGVAYGQGGNGIVELEGAGLDISPAGEISLDISDLPDAD